MNLPIHKIKDEFLDTVQANSAVILSSPTGSGKSTQIPQFLLDSGFIEGRILVLQPRRIAARALATRIAYERQKNLGGEVGYVLKLENRSSQDTRILFITEGILLRMLHDNPTLRGIGAVVFDEFHERNWQSDTGLALVRDILPDRPDLKAIVMSATLDTEELVKKLSCPLIKAEGRSFPVDISCMAPQNNEDLFTHTQRALKKLLSREKEGDILIFMPGTYEIRKSIEKIKSMSTGCIVLPLYGELAPEKQDLALKPQDQRKIIIATNVAETSLTIPGVRHVIDSGLARMSRYDSSRGMGSLLVERISAASADQRSGRAGRTSSGTCIRLWSAGENQRLALTTPAEILRIDLGDFLLQITAMGFHPDKLAWITPPEVHSLNQARKMLTLLGAFDGEKLSVKGARMAKLPLSPRLAAFLLEADRHNLLAEAALWAALINEKGPFLNRLKMPSKYKELTEELGSEIASAAVAYDDVRRSGFDINFCRRTQLSLNGCRQVERSLNHFQKNFGSALRIPKHLAYEETVQDLLQCLILAFPDHIARRRDKSSLLYELSENRGAELNRETAIKPSLALAIEINEIGGRGRVQTKLSGISAISEELLYEVFPQHMREVNELQWNRQDRRVERRYRHYFQELIIADKELPLDDKNAAGELLAEKVIAGDLQLKKWDKSVDAWIQRVRFVGKCFPEKNLMDYNEEDLAFIISEICSGQSRYKDIKDIEVLDYFINAMNWDEQQFVRQMAPERLDLPSGRKMRLSYDEKGLCRGRSFISDLFGLEKTPSIAGGRCRFVLEILAPNHRPIQITEDLESFWRDLYPEVKKQLSRRYPKHKWI